METREEIEAWADAMLEQHRDPPPPERATPWYRREFPRLRAFMQGMEGLAMIVLALIGLAIIHVTFNSG